MPTDSRQLAVTPDGNHAAVIGMAGSRPAVFVDGNTGSPYTEISPWVSLEQGKPKPPFLAWSADNTSLAYVASKGGQFTLVINQREGPLFDAIMGVAFSPVGHRIAYIARKGIQDTAANPMQFFVVVDGQTSPVYRAVRELQFSADGRHVGYIATAMSGNEPHRAVVDGKESAAFAGMSDLILSPSGGRYAYVAQTLGTNRITKSLVVDGTQGPGYDEIRGLVFSADGKHFAYFAAKAPAGGDTAAMRWTAVIDGKPGPEFQQLPDKNVVFSPDGQRTAYTGKSAVGIRWRAFAVVDGNKSIDYDECFDYLFSADSQHLAFYATNSNKAVAVLDGKESDAHQAIDRQSLRFSADGSHFGFVAQDESTWRAVIDNKPGAPRRDVIEGKSFEFSPDGQHSRFTHRTYSGDWNIVVDDLVDDPSSAPAKVVMTSDWRHRAAVVRKRVGESSSFQVTLDGKPVGSDYDAVNQLEISPDGQHVVYVIGKRSESGKSHVVVDSRESPAYFRVTKLLFSADSRHSAYVAWADGSKQLVVIDGFAGPVFQSILGSPNEQPGAIQFRADGSLDYYAVTDGKLAHVMFDAATIASLPKPAAGGVPTAGYAEIYSFGAVEKDGAKPAVLTAAPDGTLFGATSAGGQYRNGVIFKMQPDGSGYTIIRQILGGQNDGAYPSTILVGRDGAIYGTFLVQGPSGSGSIFRCAADGTEFKILRAAKPNIDGPDPKLVTIDANGNIIGVSGRTSSSTPTHLFRMTPAGEFTLVLDTPFKQGDYNGLGPIADGRDGFFYGVFARKIFKVKNDGTGYAAIHAFAGPPLDTWGSDQAPIVGADGRLYGIASGGGQANGGVVYSVGRDGSDYKLIVNPESERLTPRALAEGPDGRLYAIVAKGIARFNKDGSNYSIIQAAEGASFVPTALVRGDGFFGLKPSAGKGNGVVFRYGLSAPAASATPTVVIKEVPAAPLPAVEAGTSYVAPAQSPSGNAAADIGSNAPGALASAPATDAGSPAAAPNSAAAVSPDSTQPVSGSASTAQSQTANQATNTPANSTPAGAPQPTALKQAEDKADATLNKAKAKVDQAANKAKTWLDLLTKKK